MDPRRRRHTTSGGGLGAACLDFCQGYTGSVTAMPLLQTILTALEKARLEAVLIGAAAAAIHGAPVTTLDFDFMFRRTPLNLKKLKTFADEVGGVILRPYYPVSSLYRVVNENTGLQADFMAVIHGVKSFNSLRSRAQRMTIGGRELLVADLADIIASKKAAGRARDRAMLEILQRTLDEKNAQS